MVTLVGKSCRKPIDDVLRGLQRVVNTSHPNRAMGYMICTMLVTWFAYVPIHELLHALGCLATGGSVSKLEIAPQYGAVWLSQWFPFIVSGSEYAGRLSGFDTHGSDWVYLATVFAPFMLSVLVGVYLVKLCARKRRPFLFGTAIVIGLAPFYNLQGDYYEMGSIITTRLVVWCSDIPLGRWENLRSDDIFKLCGQLINEPSKLLFEGFYANVAAWLVVLISFVGGIVLAFTTYWLGDRIASLVTSK